MEQFLFMLPILIVVVVLLTVVVQRLAGAWVEHRVRMSLLRRLEQKPELLDSFEEVQDLLHEQPAERAQPRQDFTLTGVLLAAMGLVAVVVASTFDSGRVAVGAYFGGVACVCIGFILALTGLLIRFLARAPQDRPPE